MHGYNTLRLGTGWCIDAPLIMLLQIDTQMYAYRVFRFTIIAEDFQNIVFKINLN